MTLRHMKIFLEVNKLKNITKAAENLYISQPAVSSAIKELEEHYNQKLFDRISNHLYLTDTGRISLEYATHVVSLFDEMYTRISNSDNTAKLRIGSSITIGTIYMPLYVNSFKTLYPKTDVYITIDSSNSIENKILQNELDFALIEGIVHSDNIISDTYMDDELVIVCNPNHYFSNKTTEINVEEFVKESILLREKGSGTRELLDDVLASHGYSVSPKWESTSTAALINAVVKGIGISVLPLMLVYERVCNGTLAIVKINGLEFKRKFNIIYHRNKFMTKAAKKFIYLCKNS